ncbi:excinuclease ABC subunit UvrC [Candidatus Gracilibacteria bacterium]|nr:excinuclease ABC subunit UvrC [Candidatus Gracilibacteria bacterium]
MSEIHIESILKTLPSSPGIYQFFNDVGEIIYIGKAKILKNRVKSYFNGTTKLNFAKKKMLDEIVDIKYIMTETEIEALLLENNLVKKHQPRYNVLLKDDKNFLYIKITSDEYPKVIRTRIPPRSKGKLEGKYFGPYLSGYSVFHIFKILKKIFGYGVGKYHFFKSSNSYTLDPYIFSGNIEAEEGEIKKIYHEKIQEISKFLSGDTGKLSDEYRKKMLRHAEKQEYEEAQKYKEILSALSDLGGYQVVQTEVRGNYIALQFLKKYDTLFAGVIIIEDSKLISYESYEFLHTEMESDDELQNKLIEEIIVGLHGSNIEKNVFRFLFSELPKGDVLGYEYEIPELGPKYDIMKLCYKNIYEYAQKKHLASLSTKSFTKQTMKNILDMLGYKVLNTHIVFECNDISHLSGSHTVASRSVIENGKKHPQKYKKFRIKTLDEGKIDDFGSMREIMTRRIKEIYKVGNTPDLIIIDGGRGQLSSVMQVIKEFEKNNINNFQSIPLQIVSLAKREEELFLPGKKEPIILDKDSLELRLIQAIRDEAHRFAITFNRDSRNKQIRQSLLEVIPGIGPKTRKKILKLYGSVNNLKNQDAGELENKLGKHITEILDMHGLL